MRCIEYFLVDWFHTDVFGAEVLTMRVCDWRERELLRVVGYVVIFDYRHPAVSTIYWEFDDLNYLIQQFRIEIEKKGAG